jgi:hypothetical protein
MAWVANDGFDTYNGVGPNTGASSKWQGLNSAVSSLVGGRFGGQALQMNAANISSGNVATRFLTSSRASGANAFAVYLGSYTNRPENSGPFVFAQGGTTQFTVKMNQSGGLDVWRGPIWAGTKVANTASGVLLLSTWQYLEMLWTCSSSAGVLQFLIDGTPLPALTGLNIQSAATPACDSIQLAQSYNTGGSGYTFIVDDYNEGDAPTTMGVLRVETLRPTRDSSIAWTPSSGANNFSRVNETLVDGDTSYVQTTTVGARDLYGFGPLSSTPAAIAGVQASSFGYKTDAAAHILNNSVTSGATASDGPALTLPSSYAKFERPMVVDPNTGVAWTPAAIAALLAGPTLAS